MLQTQREAFAKSRRRRREPRELITAMRADKPYTVLMIAALWAMFLVPVLNKDFAFRLPW
ncbi:hypothetical protein [Streptomyces sp. ALI-76-A]|uniref:hypothetical protein n=1 Tax=Streptomyces sp. ALI-76-A TaxID=3025736 RepID=UPI00256ECA54|nr:hypothetical protein [Streptomyces sp. ALI-76-A]MDL5206347.1 hypothetical protein [Streptomyces sp. ALI-76-A]